MGKPSPAPSQDAASFSRGRARIPFTAPITLSEGDTPIFRGAACDLGMNGMFALTAKPLALGARFSFSIHLSVGMRRENISGVCQVVRVVSVDDGLSAENPGPGMGLKFLELEEGHGELLYQLIRHNAG